MLTMKEEDDLRRCETTSTRTARRVSAVCLAAFTILLYASSGLLIVNAGAQTPAVASPAPAPARRRNATRPPGGEQNRPAPPEARPATQDPTAPPGASSLPPPPNLPAEIINQVQRAYWELVFALHAQKVALDSLNPAREQFHVTEQGVAAGTTAPLGRAEVDTQIATNEANLLAAAKNITLAENAFKQLVLRDPTAPEWRAATSITRPSKSRPSCRALTRRRWLRLWRRRSNVSSRPSRG